MEGKVHFRFINDLPAQVKHFWGLEFRCENFKSICLKEFYLPNVFAEFKYVWIVWMWMTGDLTFSKFVFICCSEEVNFTDMD